MLFWKKKKPCIHEWVVSDYEVSYDWMAHREEYYKLACLKCNHAKYADEEKYNEMLTRGLVTKAR